MPLCLVAAAASLWASAAFADDPVCDYDVTVLDRAAAKVEIKVACDPALKVQKFTALSDRRHWSTEAATYRDGQGDFKYDLGAFAAEEDDMGSAMPYGDGVLVTPAFLLPLPETDAAAMLRFRVTFADGGVAPHRLAAGRGRPLCRAAAAHQRGRAAAAGRGDRRRISSAIRN